MSCVSTIPLVLDGNSGFATLTSAMVDLGCTDNCGIASFALTRTVFTLSDVGIPTQVTMTATDGVGNSDSCTFIVNVLVCIIIDQ
jgi:hypothetical protein